MTMYGMTFEDRLEEERLRSRKKLDPIGFERQRKRRRAQFHYNIESRANYNRALRSPGIPEIVSMEARYRAQHRFGRDEPTGFFREDVPEAILEQREIHRKKTLRRIRGGKPQFTYELPLELQTARERAEGAQLVQPAMPWQPAGLRPRDWRVGITHEKKRVVPGTGEIESSTAYGESPEQLFERLGGDINRVQTMTLDPDDPNALALSLMPSHSRMALMKTAGLNEAMVKAVDEILQPSWAGGSFATRQVRPTSLSEMPKLASQSFLKTLQIVGMTVDPIGTAAFEIGYESIPEDAPGWQRYLAAGAGAAVFGAGGAAPRWAGGAATPRWAGGTATRASYAGALSNARKSSLWALEGVRTAAAQAGSKKTRAAAGALKRQLKQAKVDSKRADLISAAEYEYGKAISGYAERVTKKLPEDSLGLPDVDSEAFKLEKRFRDSAGKRLHTAIQKLSSVTDQDNRHALDRAIRADMEERGLTKIFLNDNGAPGEIANVITRHSENISKAADGASIQSFRKVLAEASGAFAEQVRSLEGVLLGSKETLGALTPLARKATSDQLTDARAALAGAEKMQNLIDGGIRSMKDVSRAINGLPWEGKGFHPLKRELAKQPERNPHHKARLFGEGSVAKTTFREKYVAFQEAFTDVFAGMRASEARLIKAGVMTEGIDSPINSLVTAPGMLPAGQADFRLFIGKVQNILKQSGNVIKLDDVNTIVALRHYKDVMRMHPGRLMPDGLDELSIMQNIAATLSSAGKHADLLDQAAALVPMEYQRMLREAVEAGIVHRKLAAELTELYPNYNPMAYIHKLHEEVLDVANPSRPLEETLGVGSNNLRFLSETGATLAVRRPLEVLLDRMVSSRILTHRNRTVAGLIDKLQNDPEYIKEFRDVTKSKKPAKGIEATRTLLPEEYANLPVEDQAGKLLDYEKYVEQINAAKFGDEDVFKTKKGRSGRLRDIVELEGAVAAGKEKNTVVFMKNGERQEWEVPEWFSRELKFLVQTYSDDMAVEGLKDAFRALQSIPRAAFVTYNPIFAAKNMSFDFLTALISKGVMPWEFASGLLKGISQFDSSLEKQLYEASGAMQGRFWGRTKSTKDVIREAGLSNGVVDTTKNWLRHVEQILPGIGEVGEQAARRATFAKTLDKIYPNWKTDLPKRGPNALASDPRIARAAAEAVEVTINFRRGGHVVNVLNNAVLFLRAAIGGVLQPGRAFGIAGAKFTGANPMKARWTMSGVVMAKLAIDAYNVRQPGYYDIPEDVRWNSVVLMLPGTKKDRRGRNMANYILPVPIVREWAGLLGGTAVFAEYLHNKDKPKFTRFMNSVMPSLSPIPDLMPMPEVLRQIVEQRANWNFFTGEDIVPGNLRDEERKEQFDTFTPLPYKIPGVGNIPILGSPKRLQHLVESTGGTPAKIAVKAIDAFVRTVFMPGVDDDIAGYVKGFIQAGEVDADSDITPREAQALYMRGLRRDLRDKSKSGMTLAEADEKLDRIQGYISRQWDLAGMTGFVGKRTGQERKTREEELGVKPYAETKVTYGQISELTGQRIGKEEEHAEAYINAGGSANTDAAKHLRNNVNEAMRMSIQSIDTLKAAANIFDAQVVTEAIDKWKNAKKGRDLDSLPNFRELGIAGKDELATFALLELRKSYVLAESDDGIDYDLQEDILERYQIGWSDEIKNYVEGWIASRSYGHPLVKEFSDFKRDMNDLQWWTNGDGEGLLVNKKRQTSIMDWFREDVRQNPRGISAAVRARASTDADIHGLIEKFIEGSSIKATQGDTAYTKWLTETYPNATSEAQTIFNHFSKFQDYSKIQYRLENPSFDVNFVRFYGAAPVTTEARVEMLKDANGQRRLEFNILPASTSPFRSKSRARTEHLNVLHQSYTLQELAYANVESVKRLFVGKPVSPPNDELIKHWIAIAGKTIAALR